MFQGTLTLIVFLPLAGAILIAALLVGRDPRLTRLIAVAVFSDRPPAGVLSSGRRHPNSIPAPKASLQFVERYADWIPFINVQYFFGVDGLSMPMVVLTGLLLSMAAVLAAPGSVKDSGFGSTSYALLVLQTGVMGVFHLVGPGAVLFFMFWEVELVPMYLLISIWGSGRKEYSAMKFLIYHRGRQRLHAGGNPGSWASRRVPAPSTWSELGKTSLDLGAQAVHLPIAGRLLR